MLPLAWAVVEYEKKETWTWFIKLLKEDLGLGDGEDLTLITDMQKVCVLFYFVFIFINFHIFVIITYLELLQGLIGAILNILPLAEHRMCARHILANWAKDWRGLQRRQQFWSIAKSTFESQLRKNVAKMKLLGPEKMMDDLMYYNIEYWCKVYFNSQVKCDSVDNNMSECFNSWILAARHKTIITMLDEIRVKMMTRIAKLREFTNTWMCDFSPMSLKVLQENIDRSMNCNIEFNGVDGFEVKEGTFQHSVDLGRWTCSCRVWQLKGIPCAHVVAAIYFKKCEPLDYINNCYSKTTYLRTYANVLQPVTNMEMWPVSTNPTVAPPEIKSMPGRPGKLRKKEAGESKKSGKLPRTGLAMTCSNCNVRGHNKRGCPQRVESSTREEPSNTDKGNGKTSGLGRPKVTSLPLIWYVIEISYVITTIIFNYIYRKHKQKVSLLQRGQEEDHLQHLVHLQDLQRGQEEDHWQYLVHLQHLQKVQEEDHLMHLQHLQRVQEEDHLQQLVHLLHVHHLLITMLDLLHLLITS